ncbi:MAG TPA: hypothetical protein VFZ91_10560 [Allosphingosinicella sp.]
MQQKRPHRYFYMLAVRETLDRGDRAEIESLVSNIREVQRNYGDLDGLIKALEDGAKQAG